MLLLLLAGGRQAAAQVRVEGTVVWKDGSPAAGLTVAIPDLSLTTTTDAAGRYVFDSVTPAVRATVAVALNGQILARRFGLFTLAVERLDFQLVGTPASPGPALGPLATGRTSGTDVRQREILPLVSPSDAGALRAEGGRLEAIPTLGWADALSALGWFAGIAATENAEGMVVEAAAASQSLARLDGFTLYRADHLGGRVSAFNMHGVGSVEVSRSVVDARVGERLANALEISSPTRPAAVHGGASVSLVDAAGAIGVPVGSRTSLWAAGRKSIRSPLDDRLLGGVVDGRSAAGPVWPAAAVSSSWQADFDDAHGRLEVRASDRDRLAVAAYIGHDDTDGRQVVRLPAGMLDRLAALDLAPAGTVEATRTERRRSTGLSARWDRQWTPRLGTSARFARSDFDHQVQRSRDVAGAADGDEGAGELNLLDEETGAFELAASFGSQELTLGAERTSYRTAYRFGNLVVLSPASPITSGPTVTSDLSRRVSANLTSVFASHRLWLGSRLTANAGLRVTDQPGAAKTVVQPSAHVALHLSRQLRATGAWGRSSQAVTRVPIEDLRSLPRGFWTLADGVAILTPTATSVSGGITYTAGRFLLDAHGFARELAGLARLAPRLVGATAGLDLSRYLSVGSGRAKGIALQAQATLRQNSALVAYTASRATDDFPALGGPFPADHDRRHELKIVDAAAIGPLTVSAAWVRASGLPVTVVTGVAAASLTSNGTANTALRLVAGPTNGVRLAPYHRLDLGATYELRLAGNRRATLGVTAFNLSDRANPAGREFTVVGGEVAESTATAMRRVVNLTLSVRF